MNKEQLDEFFAENPDILAPTGFDDAIIGTCERLGMHGVALYDYDHVIAILIDEGMTYEESVEFFGFNILGAWVGEMTPVFAHLAER
jgi:hypothetical protein